MLNSNISKEHREALHSYLKENFGVTAVIYSFPFLYLECYPNAPPESERPFSVAGAISVWLDPGQTNQFCISVGEAGNGVRILIAEHLKKDLYQMQMPRKETLLALVRAHFPTAIAISYIWDAVVVELPKIDHTEFGKLLQGLPEGFMDVKVALEFHNGPLPYTEHKRLVKPDPTYSYGPKAIADESNYVKDHGCFYPGSMIYAADDTGKNVGSATAGILVEKGLNTRLTVSYHCWESLVQQNPDTFGTPQNCTIMQGDPGTEVGFAHERISNTDIALAKLLPSIEFRNEFMEIDVRPKRFLPAEEISIMDDFMIDSFVTGKQRLRCVGMRYLLQRRKNARSHPLQGPESHVSPDENIYIQLSQGIYATNEQKIPRQPQIREGVCGAVLVRCGQRKNRNRILDSVLKDGEVAGIMHYADLQSKGNLDSLLCYADSFDELAGEGWKVVQTAQKRKDREEDNKVVEEMNEAVSEGLS